MKGEIGIVNTSDFKVEQNSFQEQEDQGGDIIESEPKMYDAFNETDNEADNGGNKEDKDEKLVASDPAVIVFKVGGIDEVLVHEHGVCGGFRK